MEKAVRPFTLVVALTYNEETEENRRSARMFDYKDVSDFIKRLRRAMEYHLERKGALSFIAAGEKGDRFNRCHWHVVLFSEVDFLSLGEWRAPWGVVTDPKDIVSPVGIAEPWRRTWSLWGRGFVTVQEPDYGGMRYAMSYALKDQFNVRNSEGQAREAKAEVFGTGYLAMSKKPAIGSLFVDRYLAELEAEGVLPPSRKLKIPEVKNPWWPTGVIRAQLLEGFARINRGIREKTGRDAAAWSTLLHEARLSEDDLELLGVYDGEEEEQGTDEWRQILANSADNAEGIRRRETKVRCGSTLPCSLCLRGSPSAADHYALEEASGITGTGWQYTDRPNGREWCLRHQRDGKHKGPNPFCGIYGDPVTRAGDAAKIWPASARGSSFAEGARAGRVQSPA